MKQPEPHNNEFKAAEQALRNIGSHLWFGGLPEAWQEYLIAHTVECFDNYEVTMDQAANAVLKVYQDWILAYENLLELDPWSI